MNRHNVLKYLTAGLSLLLFSICLFWAVIWEIVYWHKSVSDAFNASWWNWVLFPTFLVVAVLALSGRFPKPSDSVKVTSKHTGGDTMNPTKRSMPLWIGLLCAVCAISSLGFTVFAVIQNYEVYLPMVADLTVKESPLQFDSIDFNYNSETKQYTYATVSVYNPPGSAATVKTEIWCYTSTGVIAADGYNPTTTISSGATKAITVNLNWNIGYTVFNLTRIEIQVAQI